MTQAERGEAFRALHEGEPFVIPNPWDAGSARVLEALGFEALATTSGGFAFSLGKLDGRLSLDKVIERTAEIAEASELPVSVDLENGFGPKPEDAATAITRAAEAGAVGGSIEDYGPEVEKIYEFDLAVERVAAAVEAARALDFPFTLTARAENVFRGVDDIDDTIARLRAFEEAGADVIYAPWVDVEQLRAIRQETTKPINFLARSGLSFREVVDAGAQRISVGSRLALVAFRAFADAAEEIRDSGDFSSLGVRIPVDEWFGD